MSEGNPTRAFKTKGTLRRPTLTHDEIEEFLDAARKVPDWKPKVPHPGFWLIFRLIIEHGIKTGEVTGKGTKTRPGIQFDDLEEDSIWIHTSAPGDKRFAFYGKRLGKKDYIRVPVSTDLLREIRKFADRNGLKGRLFNLSEDYIRYLTRKFAKDAGIAHYDLLNPETLRDGFKKFPSPFQIDIGAFDGKLLRRSERMAQYYKATFCIEKGLRELVSKRMTQTYTDKWWEEKVDSKLQSDVENRQKEELGTLMFVRSVDPMEYTTFIELMSILEQYWQVFLNDFSIGLDRLRDTVNTLNQLRHVIAHNSEFTDEQKKKFEVIMDDWRAMQPT